MDSTREFLKPFLLVGAVVLGVLLTGQSQLSHAATITVNTTDDELNADGDCSLREAIQAANTDGAVDACTAGSGTDTIVVPAGTYTLSIAGAGEDANATGDLDITTSLTLNGAGASTTMIDGADLDRVFHIYGGVTVEISGVTIQNGSSSYGGGGIFNAFSSTLTVTNSTLSGNSVTNTGGGGIVNFWSSTLTVTNSTLSGNSAPDGGGIINFGPTTSKNTIVANNTASSYSNCYGGITSSGYNLSSDSTCGFTATGDLQNTDPLLGPLANNGGPTQTHALLSGSPAIDAGSSDCPPPATDQRGVTRPQGAACDIGAYELLAVLPMDIDIKPGSFPNSINLKSKGVIPVAILTTGTFDATTVDATTVLFGPTGTEAAPVQSALEDVDGDGDTDRILHFRTQATGIVCGDTSASLTGETVGGQSIEGSDSIRTVCN